MERTFQTPEEELVKVRRILSEIYNLLEGEDELPKGLVRGINSHLLAKDIKRILVKKLNAYRELEEEAGSKWLITGDTIGFKLMSIRTASNLHL